MIKFAQALRNLRDEESGFTLIELMVVIVIIGILAAVAIPQFANIINNSRVQADVATGKTIKDAVDRYYTDNGAYPGTTGAQDIDVVVNDLMPTGADHNKYLNAAPTSAQKGTSDLNQVYLYDSASGNVAVANYSSKTVVWQSGPMSTTSTTGYTDTLNPAST